MKRVLVQIISSCYHCPEYRRFKNIDKDYCDRTGRPIIIRPDKDGHLIDKDCPLKEDK